MLVLDSVNNTDSGEYVCRAFNNPLCYSEEKIKLTVECEFIYIPLCVIVISKNVHIYVSTYLRTCTTLITINMYPVLDSKDQQGNTWLSKVHK